jgi:2-(1,2-epoxy-1,2-dihydrophenyl)acetyl-CoA isomerase
MRPEPLKRSDRQMAMDLYTALAGGDRGELEALLHPRFTGHATEGLPVGLGGSYPDPSSMRREFWGGIARRFDARAEPTAYHHLDDGRLLVQGHYVGVARDSGRALDAEFVHLLRFADGHIIGLEQLTDSARWSEALAPAPVAPAPTPSASDVAARPTAPLVAGGAGRTVGFDVSDGLGILTIDRPEARNGIDQAMAAELLAVALDCAQRPDLRALLIRANGKAFTVGGDVKVFAGRGAGELPRVLREMIGSYHQALQILAGLDVPIVAAVHGAVAGGGLGLMYAADIVVAAEGTKFATGFAGLGLSGDGGNSWWLPRLVGPRRAAELYLEPRVLNAQEAQSWGLVTRVVEAEALEGHALATARRLAAGPTRALGEMRHLLARSWDNGLVAQHGLELEAMARTAATTDASEAIDSFVDKRTPTFEGR